jgi:type III pantothenate kinase
MLLVIDVGNTNTVMGVYRADELLGHWRLETKKERTSDEMGIFIKELLAFSKYGLSEIEAIAISNVVPTLGFALTEMSKRYFGLVPFVVGANVKSPLSIKLDNPKEIGADRIVNAVAAHAEYKNDCVVIDFGTATTFDVVTAAGEYLGGVICPGVNVSAEALFHRASKLPRVEIAKPERVIGSNTVACLQSGLYYGYIGLVDSLVERIRKESGKKLKVIATGGLAGLIAKDSKTIETVDDFLTLKGLKILNDLNA